MTEQESVSPMLVIIRLSSKFCILVYPKSSLMYARRTLPLLFSVLFYLCCLQSYAQKPGAYKCLDFDGTDDYVLINDHSSLNSDTTITVEAWIKADAYGRNVYDNSIFCKHGWSRGNLGYVLRCGSNGKISFNISDASGTWQEAASASIMETGVWYHVAGSFDGDSVNVYINGELVGTTLYSGKISPSSGLTARIGDLANGGGRLFDGMIDEVRVWSTDVDESTLRDWMCRKINSSHPNYSNLVGNWKLDEDSGTNAADASGTGNKGSLNNGPTHQLSGAVLGDTSVHVYGGTLVSLKSKYNDVFTAYNITGSPDLVHLVAEYQSSEQSLTSGLSGQLDSSHFFSMFYPPDTSVTFSISYDFGDKKNVTGNQKCGIDLFRKTPGYQGQWEQAGATFHQSGDSLTIHNQRIHEYGLISYPTDSNHIVTSSRGSFVLCGNDKLDLIAIGNDSFSYTWFLNDSQLYGVTGHVLTVDSVADYRVEITRNNSACKFQSKTISVSRISKPTVTLSAFKGVCESVDTLVLTGGSPTGGTYTGTGVNGSNFLPSVVKQGSYTITYSFTDSNQCSNNASQTIQVFGLPNLTSSGTASYCNDLDSVKLDAVTPQGGTYSGPFISNNYFHIDSANRVNKLYPYNYTYTDGNGCSNSYADSLEIKWATPCTLAPIAPLCYQDDSVLLKGTPTTGSFSGKGVTGSFFNPTQAGVGEHTIVYSFTNLLKCTTTDTQQVKVIANGSVQWSQAIQACINGDSIKLNPGTPTGGYFKGNGVASSAHFKPDMAGVGNHVLSYITIDSNGCHNKAYNSVVVNDTTTITFSTPPAICLLGDPITLSVASPIGGEYTGNGVSSDTFFPARAGFGKIPIRYSFTNKNNCTSTDFFHIEVYQPDSISITAKDKMCTYDDPVVLKTYPSGGVIKGKGVIGSVFSPSISGSGKHVILYEISGSNGCAAKDSIEISVGAQPVVDIEEIGSICESEMPFKLAHATPKDVGLYLIKGVVTDSILPKQLGPGTHVIMYRVVTEEGCRDSASTPMIINPNPDKPIITKTKNTLKSSQVKGNQWYTTTGILVGETSQTFEAQENGLYWTIVTSDSGCTAMSDTFDFSYVGIHKIPSHLFHVGPNPSNSGVFNVLSQQVLQGVKVFDMNGNLVMSNLTSARNYSLDLSDHPGGIYLLMVTKDEIQYAMRLMKH